MPLWRRHVPSYYERELLFQLQKHRQRDLIVEEYRQKIKLLMLRARVKEKPEDTISRFKSGLNLEIQYRVELFPFNYFKNLDDFVQLCARVEQQLKSRTTIKPPQLWAKKIEGDITFIHF